MDIKKLMSQAQSMQKKVQEAQAEFSKREFQGESGGGLVSITMTGNGEMRKVDINPSLLQESEKEMLEDLIVAAHNNSKVKADSESKNNMSDMFGGFNLPAGFNF